VPGLPPNFKLPAWAHWKTHTAQDAHHAGIWNVHCPGISSWILLNFLKIILFSHTNEPTWHSNVPHLVPTIIFCAQMFTLYVSH
jgi:hypothetical protein